MKRLVATFDDEGAATDADRAVRDAGLTPREAAVDAPFLDPTATMPERRGLLWGGLLGAVLGTSIMLAMAANLLWIPRTSPAMTAGPYMLGFFGFGVGAAVGGFVGGAIGTYREVPRSDRPRLAVVAPDQRADEIEDLLRRHDAHRVERSVLTHDHPQQRRLTDSDAP
ncbi:hypothetical protein [Halovivax limisalsi]|uniref:hypothetical protein n=1 Tax=Halovivax limisalsi TaxID=1453760 RepID=UPI001FFC9915|nr:hypothetical protein [Halovivax limisalsi]